MNAHAVVAHLDVETAIAARYFDPGSARLRVSSVVRGAPGFDVPEFLAAGPRHLLVAASDVAAAQDVLREVDSGQPGPPTCSSEPAPIQKAKDQCVTLGQTPNLGGRRTQ